MAKLSPERWARLQAVLQAALPLNAHERRALLDRACADDEALRREVEALLAADDRAANFLQNNVASLGWQALADAELRRKEMIPSKQELNNRYEIVGELGSGGMGMVYQARAAHLNNLLVAIKVLPEKWRGNTWVVSRFKQEAAILAKLDDPGIVGILDAGELSDGRPWFAMRYVDGEELTHVIRRGKLPLVDVAEIVKQISRTLTVAHEAGVIHRDLKPSNIMVRRATGGEWQVKVIDFGIAKVFGSAQEMTQFPVGTLPYMSPEQHQQRELTAASDIHALGSITYEMLTGVRPFEANSADELAALKQGVLKTKPSELRPDVPKAADDVIAQALKPSPHERHHTAREFGEALIAALTGAIAEVRIQPYLFAGFLRKPWMTYSVRDGRAYTEGGLIWRSASSTPLVGATVTYGHSLFGYGRIKVTKDGATQKWSKVPNARRVYDALVRVSKDLPLTDLEDDAPMSKVILVGFIIAGCLTIAAWYSLLTIPWNTGDAATLRNDLIPAFALASISGVLVAIFRFLRRGLLKSKPEPLGLFGVSCVTAYLVSLVGSLFIIQPQGAMIAEIGLPSWGMPILPWVGSVLIGLGLPLGAMTGTAFLIGFVVNEIRSAVYEGTVPNHWVWWFYAWGFGMAFPPIGWLFGLIGILFLALTKEFVAMVSDADAEKLARWKGWRKKALPVAGLLSLLTMLLPMLLRALSLRYTFNPRPIIETSVLIVGTAAMICSVMFMFSLLVELEKQGAFIRLRKWRR